MISIDSLAEHDITVHQYENFCDMWKHAREFAGKRFAKMIFEIKRTLELSDEQLLYLIEMEGRE